MEQTIQVFAALSDPIRLRALALIAREGELCVCELVGALDLPQPKISRHMRVLGEAGLVSSRREAQWVLYALSDKLPKWMGGALAAAIEGASREPQHREDRKRLKSVNRPPLTRQGKAA